LLAAGRATHFFEPRFVCMCAMLAGRRLTGRSGDNNARRAWPIKQRRQRHDSTLVEPALERPGNICPVCKTTDWSLTSHLVNVQRFATDANASNTPTYPHIIVTCKFCAHSMFFNAVQIGIAAPPARQPTAGAASSDFVAKVNEMGQEGIVGLTRSLADLIKKQD
jgi:hypothetical protein